MLKNNREKKVKEMTLIIGACCSNGVILVADRKITDSDATEETYEPKIYPPIQNVAVCASGYRDLFREFNRKIRIKVEEREREFYLRNFSALKQLGLDEGKIKKILSPKQANQPESFEEQKDIESSKIEPELPSLFSYNAEYFLDDCKELVEKICDAEKYGQGALEVLLLINTGTPTLHKIDFRGCESQIDKGCIATGAGSPFLNLFFKKLWNSDMDMVSSVVIACFCIKAVQNMKLENSVGIETEKLPDIIFSDTNGRHGTPSFSNTNKILAEINKGITNVENSIKDIKINKLTFSQE